MEDADLLLITYESLNRSFSFNLDLNESQSLTTAIKTVSNCDACMQEETQLTLTRLKNTFNI